MAKEFKIYRQYSPNDFVDQENYVRIYSSRERGMYYRRGEEKIWGERVKTCRKTYQDP